MSQDVSQCPEEGNSTDCLLRELLSLVKSQLQAEEDNFAEYNWDPLTFAFTVIIGITTGIFAFIAILQAFLASGTGRRKANKRAIGEWSAWTKKEWHIRDLGYQTIACTPILKMKALAAQLDQIEGAGPPKWGTMTDKDNEDMAAWLYTVFGVQDFEATMSKPAATWIEFLDLIGLTYDYSQAHSLFQMKPTSADYLPDDVIAAPAYAQVGFILTTIAVAGGQSWQIPPQSSYPVIVGQGFQFDFRQHQTMGTVGVFTMYDRTSANPFGRPTKMALRQGFRHSRGEVTAGHDFPFSIKTDALEDVAEQSVIERKDGHGLFIRPDSRFNSDGAVLRLIHGGHCKVDMCQMATLNEGLCAKRDDHHLLWLLLADVPSYIPCVFPLGKLRVENLFEIMILSSPMWRSITRLEMKGHLYDTILRNLPVPEGFIGGCVLEDFLGPDRPCACVNVWHACIKLSRGWQVFQHWLAEFTLWDRDHILSSVLIMLKRTAALLERTATWNSNWGGVQGEEGLCSLVSCRTVNLQLTTTALMNLDKGISDGTISEHNGTRLRMHSLPKVLVQPRRRSLLNNLSALLGLHSPPEDGTLGCVPPLAKDDKRQLSDYLNGEPLNNLDQMDPLLQQLEMIVMDFAETVPDAHLGVETDSDGCKQYQRSPGDVVTDLLILKAMLTAILFWTAADCSPVQEAGVWEHIIPVL